MAITAETLRIAAQLRRQVGSIVDGVTRSLTAAWVQAWDDVLADVLAAVTELLHIGGGAWPTRRQVERTARVVRALDVIGATLERLAELARTETVSAATQAARLGYESQGELVASQLPHGSTRAAAARHHVQQPDAIDAIVRRTAEQINARHWPLADEATAAMKRELVRGVVVGDNPRTAAARMVRNLEGEFNGGLTRALNLARTETLDAHREAAEIGQEQHEDVLDGWVWMAELNNSRGRTCPACWAMHGKVFPLSEPGPIDHQQGRCSRTPKTKSWADLGFDVDEPDDLIPDARAIFDDLPEDEQVAIMGRARLDLLRSGDITWDDLPELRTTPGWRDSYGVRPVKDLVRIADGDKPRPAPEPAGRPEPEDLPDAPNVPEVPDGAQPYHRDLDGIEDLARAVEDQEETDSRRLGGSSAVTELVTLADGTQVIRKSARAGSEELQDADAEQAASLVARALGLAAPAVYRDGPGNLYMEYVADGVAADEAPADRRVTAASATDQGALVGLLDLLVNNVDRNGGNWLLRPSGELVPIDHGMAYGDFITDNMDPTLEWVHSRFADRFKDPDSNEPVGNPLTREDVAEARRRLQALRPDFEHLGRGHWLDYSLRMLRLLGRHASGRRNLIAGVR